VIRKAKPSDIGKIVELGIESLEKNDPYPELRISREKVKEMATEMVSGASHFAWVDEQDGEVVGAVCAYTSEILFHERKQADVLMYYARSPGGGGWLLKQLIRWWKGRPGIKMMSIVLEEGTDPKVGEFLTKRGLKKELRCYVGVK